MAQWLNDVMGKGACQGGGPVHGIALGGDRHRGSVGDCFHGGPPSPVRNTYLVCTVFTCRSLSTM